MHSNAPHPHAPVMPRVFSWSDKPFSMGAIEGDHLHPQRRFGRRLRLHRRPAPHQNGNAFKGFLCSARCLSMNTVMNVRRTRVTMTTGEWHGASRSTVNTMNCQVAVEVNKSALARRHSSFVPIYATDNVTIKGNASSADWMMRQSFPTAPAIQAVSAMISTASQRRSAMTQS